MKVLVVEDTEDSRVLLHDVLTASGYEVRSAENGKKALKVIEDNFLPDLIVSDILMPEMDGYALCRALKADEKLRSIPFVFYTATYTDPKDEQFAMSLGAARFLIKPIEMPQFLKEIEVVLDKHKAGKLSVGQSLEKSEEELKENYTEILARKLDKKVRELEEERDKLAKARDDWESTFQAINDSVMILDLQYRIMKSNRAVYAPLNAGAEDLQGLKCHILFHDAETPCEGCPVSRTIQDSKPHVAEIEHKKLKKAFLVSSFPRFDQNGKLISIVETAKDITEKNLLEKQLRQAQKMEAIGTLAGGIAHDFNNILMAVIGYTEIIEYEIPYDSPVQKNLQEILKAGNRAKDLVAQILTFSRQSKHENKPVEVQHILKEALNLLRSSIPTTISFAATIDFKCKPILADPSRIHQIIMNLCINAYHAMQEKGGTLTVSLSEEEIKPADHVRHDDPVPGRYVKLEISDTGSGMEKHIIDKIFDPYFTTKNQSEGTGLGLAVVRGIVKRIDGHITVDSEPGKGTTFRIFFPQVHANQHTSAAKEKNREESRGNERLLIVDDEKQLIKLEEKILERLGYQVTALDNPVEALRVFQEKPEDFDLIITDMTMAEMTGAKLAEKLIEIRKDIPIILCTGYSEIIDKEKAGALGIRDFILKPIKMNEFGTAVRDVLDGKKQ